MTTTMQVGWQNLFLILTVLPCCRGLEVSIPERKYEVARGDDISLTCSFAPARPDFPLLILKWTADPDNVDDPTILVATYYLNSPVDVAPAYEGRASLEVDLRSRVGTLHLSKVTIQDSRRYQCSVSIPNDDEGTTAASTSLLVLVPPSEPICRIQGKAEYWHDISLTCMSEEGSPKPVYKWTSYSVENHPRNFPPKTTEQDGVLSLFNISRETSGFYICTSTNQMGSARCNFTLSVVPGTMDVGSIPAIIGGVFGGLLLLGIVIFCCCRKKGKKNKYAEGAPGEVEFYDRDAAEDGDQSWDDKSNSDPKPQKQYEDKDAVARNNYTEGPAGRKLEDDRHSQSSDKDRNGGKGSDVDSQRDHYRGSRDHLDDKRNYHNESRERLDDQRNRYGGSRDRLDEYRDNYRGSRDRLEDHRDNYRGSRDQLDDHRDNYRGSRDRLDDHRDNYRGSRDRLDDTRDRYGGDRFEDQRGRYGGSRDRLDYHDDQYRD